MRVANVVRALADLGPVDVVVIDNERLIQDLPSDCPPDAHRCLTVGRRDQRAGLLRDFLRWLYRGRPRRLTWGDWSLARTAVVQWLEPPYDLVWLSHADVAIKLGDLVGGAPRIVDLDNLEDQKLRRRREARAYRFDLASWRRHPRRNFGHLLDVVDEGRWRRLQHRVAAEADRVVVCSELDRDRFGGGGHVVVVPNGYDPLPLPPRSDQTHPVVTFVGLLHYAPNADAVTYLAEEILPLLQRRIADIEVRLVGHYERALAVLADVPGVTMTGEVDEVEDELSRADVVAAPIRFGSGTRVKLIEAFACGIPTVSTSVGCEGLDVRDGVHLLVADDPRTFADCILRLIEEPELAHRLVGAARDLWFERYNGEQVRATISQLAGEVVTARLPATPSLVPEE